MIAEKGRYLGVTPGLALGDPLAAYWVEQATLRMRREVCWLWRLRRPQDEPDLDSPPPVDDRLEESLDLQRHGSAKARFFREDVTAAHLTSLIERPAPDPAPAGSDPRGSWAFVARALDLDDPSQLLLGIALAARLDASLGPVLAACANDLARPYPSLALLQRLWDQPLAAAALADPSHPLYRHGLLSHPALSSETGAAALGWNRPVEAAPWLALWLAGAGRSVPGRGLPFGLTVVASADGADRPASGRVAALAEGAEALLGRLRNPPRGGLQILPLIGPRGCAFDRWAAALDRLLDRTCARLPQGSDPGRTPMVQAGAACWLLGHDLLLPEGWLETSHGAHRALPEWLADSLHLPLRILLPVREVSALKGLPEWACLPPLVLPSLDYEGRRRLMEEILGGRASGLNEDLAEAARRYRFEEETLRTALAPLSRRETIARKDLFAALALEAGVELGHLAEEVKGRFTLDELVLPPAQHRQVREIIRAMEHLTEVHYGWGTAKAWNEGGLSVLFCGAPGTGKTMAAEAVAAALGIPLYRIDLSQVVNKYIGETEKNLRRIFDATERTDCVLFFDEADALFGKRTEVKDAHDRFANIEISYLLERMERFKGLAILATNRRKDIDEAFLRRLRHIVEFPMPGPAERERIWSVVFPRDVDISGLDLPFLARQFTLAGGHIRSIAFNACLLAASGGAARRVEMDSLLLSMKRELDKMNRPSGGELFGRYAHHLQGLPA